jgi:phosphate-selective porin OprO/OprP
MKNHRKILQAAALAAALLAAGWLPADDSAEAQPGSSALSLDQRVRIIERLLENQAADTADAQKSQPKLSAAADGFSISSADSSYQLKINGYVQADGRWFLGDKLDPQVNSFLIRRARLNLAGVVAKDFNFLFQPDFGNGSVALYDAYLDYVGVSWLQLKAGKFKPLLGVEQAQSDTATLFPERGLPSSLLPTRDEGAEWHADLGKGSLLLAAGVVNGAVDSANGDSETALNDDKDLEARVFAHPLRFTGADALTNLGLGVGGTYGNRGGEAVPKYKSTGQQTIFGYASGVSLTGQAYRVSPQAYWYWDSLGLQGEYVLSSTDLVKYGKPTVTRIANEAWQAQGSYVLTGEQNTYNGVIPKHDLGKGGIGAFELAGRWGQIVYADTAFTSKAGLVTKPTAATAETSSVRAAHEWAVGINWYPVRDVKVTLAYDTTRFEHGIATVADRETEQLLDSRVQFTF